MNKKQILCTGLSLALLLSSVITTPASIAAGKYFLHTGSSVAVLLLEQNIHIQVPKKELHYNEILRNL